MVGEGEWLALGTALRRPWTRKAPLDEEGALGRGRRPWTRKAPLDEEGALGRGRHLRTRRWKLAAGVWARLLLRGAVVFRGGRMRDATY